MTPGPTLAGRLFDADLKYRRLENEAMEAVLRGAGRDPDDIATWPMEDFTHDYYDGSFEFKNTHDDFAPTKAMCKAWKALGFLRCWICYPDDTEVYCEFSGLLTHVGKRRPRYLANPRTTPEQPRTQPSPHVQQDRETGE